jgi:hypothetical protein
MFGIVPIGHLIFPIWSQIAVEVLIFPLSLDGHGYSLTYMQSFHFRFPERAIFLADLMSAPEVNCGARLALVLPVHYNAIQHFAWHCQ